MRGDDLPARLPVQPGSEELGEANMLADELLETFTAEAAQDGPELQSAEAAAEGRPVVLQVCRCRALRHVVARRAERLHEGFRPARPQAGAVERSEEPFVRVDDEGVSSVTTGEDPAKLLAHSRSAAVGAADMEPDICLLAQLPNPGHR